MTAFLDQDVGRAMYPDLLMATARRGDHDRASGPGTGGPTASAGAFHSSAEAIIANGCGWAASSTKMALPGSTATAYRRPGSVSCVCRSATSWTRGTTTGLRGTGSNDVVVRDMFVEEARTFSFQDPALIKRPGPLTPSRSCSSRRVQHRRSVSLATRSTL